MSGRSGKRQATQSPGEWVGGKLLAPVWVTGGKPYRPELILWLELPEGFVVKLEMREPGESTGFGQTLLDAMRAPLIGAPREPRRIRVADAALASEVRRATGGRIPVSVAPTPELNDIVRAMMKDMPEGDEKPSYLEGGRVSPETMACLFRDAKALWNLAPWETASNTQLLRIDVPSAGIRGACLSIIGTLGKSLGFLVFSSPECFERFVEIGESEVSQAMEHGEVDLGGEVLSLNFERGADLPPEMRREVANHGWEVAGPQAYPRVEWRERNGLPRPLDDGDVRLASAITGALSAFFLCHPDVFSRDRFAPISESYEGNEGVTVRITAPYEAFELFEDDAAADAPGSSTHGVPQVGRNDPCPCGSGKKYKKCHLGRGEPEKHPASEKDAGRRNVHVLAANLSKRVIDAVGPQIMHQFASFLDRHDFADLPPEFLVPWLVYDQPWKGRLLADHLGSAFRESLSRRELAWFDAERSAWMSVWEVVSFEPGTGMTVTDLFTGTKRQVLEHEGSKCVTLRDALLGRIVDFEGTSYFSGTFPHVLPPMEADEVVRKIRRRLKVDGEVPVERLRDPDIAVRLVCTWRDTVNELIARQSVPPRLSNTDGDSLLWTVDHFDVEQAARALVEERLKGLPGATRESDDDGATVISFSRPGRPGAPLEVVNVGTARFTARGFDLETNSVRRADALRTEVERACGPLVRHRIREHTDPTSVLERRRRGFERGAEPEPEEPAGPEIDAVIQEHKKRHYAAWLDRPLPALKGKTPRQAARSAAGRHQLDVLLKQFENHESRGPEGQRFDMSILRRALGLSG